MVASSRLHRGADQFYQRFNSIPNVMRYPSNNFIPYFQRNQNYAIEPEPETVYVNMKIESAEEPEAQYVEPETEYVNLFID
jgi:hypothetical protein